MVGRGGRRETHLDGEGLVVNGDLNFEIKAKALKILVPRKMD